MTAFDLLRHIGNVDDKYIMESRKRPKRKPVWPMALAAILALAIIGTGAGYLINLGGNAVYTDTTAESAAAGEAPQAAAEAAAPEEAPAEEAPAEEAEVVEEAPANVFEGVIGLANASYPEAIAYDDYEASSARWKENQVTEDTAYAMNAFSYKTAAALLFGKEESDCYSPLSLYHALSILAGGAEGDTRDQLLSLLGMTDPETLASEVGKLYRVNYADNEANLLRIANSLWLDNEADGAPIEYDQDWVLSTAANYYADVYRAEFENPATGKALGQWIAEKTGGALQPELQFDPTTAMAIVNTLHYKSMWAEPFNEKYNTTGDFTLESGEAVETEFMHRTESTGSVVEGEDYLKSYLTMERGKMIIVLPDEGQDIDTFLTEEKLWEVFENANYTSAEVNWTVPKFETNASYDLPEVLQALGVTDAFSEGLADFTPMTENDVPLFVSAIRQDTHIALNEEGVEAAAFTLIGMEAVAAEPEEQPIIEMDLSRPFLYLITANDGSTLFIGVVRDPTA